MSNPFGNPLLPGVKELTPEQERQSEIDRRLKALDEKEKREKERQREAQRQRQAEIDRRLLELDRKEAEAGGFTGAFTDAITQIPARIGRVASDLKQEFDQQLEDRGHPLAALGGMIGDYATSSAQDIATTVTHPRALFKGLWDSTLGSVDAVLSSGMAAGLETLGFDVPDDLKSLSGYEVGTPEGRYIATSRAIEAAAGFAVGVMVHKSLVRGNIANATKPLGLSRAAAMDEIFEFADKAAPGVALDAISSIQTNPAAFFSRVAKEGVAGGVTGALVSNELRYSDNPARDLFSYVTSSTVLALGIEGTLKVGSKLTGLGKTGDVAFKERLTSQLLHNQLKLSLGPDDWARVAQQVADGADPIGLLVENMSKDDNFVINMESIGAERAQAKYKDNVAIYKTENGDNIVFIRGKRSISLEEQRAARAEVMKEIGEPEIIHADPESGIPVRENMQSYNFPVPSRAALFKWIIDGREVFIEAGPLKNRLYIAQMDAMDAMGPHNRNFTVGQLHAMESYIKQHFGLPENTLVTGERIGGLKGALNRQKESITSNLDVTEVKGTDLTTPYTKSALTSFRKYGFFRGMEVIVNGKNMVWDRATSGNRYVVVDPGTGVVSTVKRPDVKRLNAPKTYYVEGLKQQGPKLKGGKFEEGIRKRVLTPAEAELEFKQGWDELISSLPDEAKSIVEEAKNRAYELARFDDAELALTFNKHNLVIDPKPDGTVVIRSLDNPKDPGRVVQGGVTGLYKFIDDLTGPDNAPELVKDIQADLGVSAPMRPDGLMFAEDGVRRGLRWEMHQRFFSSPIMNVLSNLPEAISGLDNRLGTNLRAQYNNLRDALAEGQAARQPYAARADAILKVFRKLPEDQKVLARQYIEAMSFTEWSQRGLYGTRPTAVAKQYVDKLVEVSTTADRITATKFISDVERILQKVEKNRMSEAQAAEAIKEIQKSYGIVPTKLGQETFDPIMLAANILLEIKTKRFAEANLSEVLKGAEIKQDGGVTRAEFAKNAGLGDDFVKVMREWEALMRAAGERAGVDPELMINGYFPHMRKYFPGMTEAQIKASKYMPPKAKEFHSKLIRAGYLDPASEIITDLGDVTARYINGIFHSEFRETALLNLKKYIDELKATQDAGNRNSLNPNERDALDIMYARLENAAGSYITPTDALAARSGVKFLDAIRQRFSGSKEIKRQSIKETGQSTDRYAQDDFISAWMKYMEFKAQGYKPMAGIRDGTAFALMYSMQLGPHRAANAMRLLPKAVKYRNELARLGKIPTLEPTLVGDVSIEIPNTSKGQSIKATVGEKFNNVVNQSFRMSLQPQIYKLAHSLSYLETTEYVGRKLKDFTSGKINQEKFQTDIGLSLYDDATIQSFQKLVGEGSYTQAMDLLARRTSDLVVGEYSRITAPVMYHYKLGKFVGQFSRWPLWGINAVSKGLTHQSKTAMAARLGFIYGTMSLANTVAEETGLDFKRWVLNPLQWFPQGSPAIQFAQDFSEMMDRTGLGAEGAKAAAIYGGKFLVNPFPLELNKILEATQRYDEGQPPEVWLYSLIGGSINSDVYKKPKIWSLWDYFE